MPSPQVTTLPPSTPTWNPTSTLQNFSPDIKTNAVSTPEKSPLLNLRNPSPPSVTDVANSAAANSGMLDLDTRIKMLLKGKCGTAPPFMLGVSSDSETENNTSSSGRRKKLRENRRSSYRKPRGSSSSRSSSEDEGLPGPPVVPSLLSKLSLPPLPDQLPMSLIDDEEKPPLPPPALIPPPPDEEEKPPPPPPDPSDDPEPLSTPPSPFLNEEHYLKWHAIGIQQVNQHCSCMFQIEYIMF
jgi:hypothetical protein